MVKFNSLNIIKLSFPNGFILLNIKSQKIAESCFKESLPLNYTMSNSTALSLEAFWVKKKQAFSPFSLQVLYFVDATHWRQWNNLRMEL